MQSRNLFTCLLLLMAAHLSAESYDVVVVQATPGGIAAAVNAAEQGLDVALTESSTHIGGLAAGGLSNTDFISFQSLGGSWKDFMNRVVDHYTSTYGAGSQQVADCRGGGWYEPHVAEQIFQDMLADAGVTLLSQHRLVSASTDTSASIPRLTGISLSDLSQSPAVPVALEAAVFIDASYAGDLIAAAGASYELENVQSYNYRVVMSTDTANQILFADVQSERYDDMDFSGLRDYLLNDEPGMDLDRLIKIRKMPNDKAEWNDINSRDYHFSIEGDGWSTSGPDYRQQMEDCARIVAQGMFHFLATDPALAAHPVQIQILAWGYAADEFQNNNNFPHALYIREGRRLHGLYVAGSHDVAQDVESSRSPYHAQSIAIGDYPSSYHSNWNNYGLLPADLGAASGDFSTTGSVYDQTRSDPGSPDTAIYPSVTTWGSGLPFCLPYGCIVPVDMDGLLAPVPCSAERSAFVRLRMEPTWAALGQAAGLAASQAIAQGIELRDVDVNQLQLDLHVADAMTYYISDVQPGDALFAVVQYLGSKGLLHDSSIISSNTNYSAPYSTADAQWRNAYKYHDVQPGLALTQTVADYLDQRFAAVWPDKDLPADALTVDGSRTRADAYQALYDAATSGDVPDLQLQSMAKSHEEIDLDWEKAAGADWYLLQRQTDPQSNQLMIILFNEPDAPSFYRDRGLDPETTYNYRLQAGSDD